MRYAVSGPHAGFRVATAGAPVEEANGAVVLLHGRGGSARDILGLAREIARPDLAYLAPQAVGNSWYPLSFLAPLEANEPHLSSALEVVDAIVRNLAERSVASGSILLAGFSQGACLTLEYVARHPRRYGGVTALTGGLLGPPERDFRSLAGDLAGTPVRLAAGDPDPHVPWERVEQSARVLERLGAATAIERYPGLPHTIHPDEIGHLRQLAARISSAEKADGPEGADDTVRANDTVRAIDMGGANDAEPV
ncbi:MAG: dienelactone hydrolase family protein [Thermoanaerobaculia bacterium]|nr:dienelactone hydrolase family protein [Thermoanaerobaculia bacterium]